jgi:hypothetical protein
MDVFAGHKAILRPEDGCDKDKLKDEFRQLELECIGLQRPKKKVQDTEKEEESQPTIKQKKVQGEENEEELLSMIEQ